MVGFAVVLAPVVSGNVRFPWDQGEGAPQEGDARKTSSLAQVYGRDYIGATGVGTGWSG